ncbi:MAG: hypothetical protein WBB43_18290 [Limnoraphis sp.]
MVKPTSFNLEDAECLLRQLNQFRETLQQEWGKVATQWDNLKLTWHDQQFDKFEPLFEKLSSTYQHEIDECEKYMVFLVQQIKTAEQRKVKLGEVFELANVGISLASLVFSSPPTAPIPPELSPNAFIEQTKGSQPYQQLPEVAHIPNLEDQLAESFVNSQESERKRRQEELEKNHNPQNSHKII